MRISLVLFLLISPLFSDEEIVRAEPLVLAADAKASKQQDGYTINYNTVSLIEYIRFASKICKVNFIYQEEDLNFTVTVVSDEPATAANVMATLIQVLRVHGLMLLEQGNNLVIHKSADVKQMATLVTEESPNGTAPIVTRIFRVKNTKPASIAAIIQPMISSSAILEVSSETKQIIITDVTANVDKIAALIENLDSPHTLLVIKNYQAANNSPEFLTSLASQIMTPIAQGNPFILVPQDLAGEIFIVSTPELADKALSVFASLDSTPKVKMVKARQEDVFVYKVLHRPGDKVLADLENIATNLKASGSADADLIQMIETAKWSPDTNSIVFIGSSGSIDKTKGFLSSLDLPPEGVAIAEKQSFFIYKPQYKTAEEIRKSILEMASNLQGAKGVSQGLIDTILNCKVNSSTHTISFSGEEGTFPRIKELLATIDTAPLKSSRGVIPASTQFYIYKPVYLSGEALYASLKELEGELKSDQLADPALLNALGTMKWVKSTRSLLFTGDPDSLKRIEGLVATVDVPTKSEISTFFQYQPKYANELKTENYLRQIIQNLSKKGGSPSLINTLKSYKWIPESKSFMFYGSQENLNQVQMLLETFDTPGSASQSTGYFIYKVQNTTGDLIEEDLDLIAKNMKASGIQESGLIDLIEKIKYVKPTNSLLLTGDAQSLEEAKQLVAQYDYPRLPAAPSSSHFFIYKPIHLPAAQLDKAIKDLSANLESAGLADPRLIKTIETSKYVSSTNTFIFTGTPESLQKVQDLLKDVDIPPATHAPIQHVGKTTFLLYKLKNASGVQIVSSIKNMTAELKKSGTADKDFVAALSTIKYVKETNSLFFTGTEESLTKVQGLVEQFDVTGLAGKQEPPPTTPTAGSFYAYKPQYVAGPELESLLQHFAENLKSSGLADAELFKTIASMRWSDKTQTLVFTGTPKSLDQIKEMVKEFDVSSNALGTMGGQKETSIQAIDNTSFLVYKLQFHKGDEIQNALRQIARDLTLSNAPVNQGLLNSINSIQWLEVTNSILCSGDQDTLTRLRELIKNLDVPLKQVFIEMLVIETTLSNALNFGLEWGANYKYRDKFGASSYNSQPITSGNTPSQFLTNFENLTPPSPPTPYGAQIPISSGFDLGVIGEVIRHNGDTFLTLGSLMSALQTDTEASIIMTPKILTQDGHTSTLFDGRNIPFVGSFVQNNSQTTVNTSNIEYRDIGLSLTVTPVLGNSDIVTLDINLDRSQTLGDVTGAALNFNAGSAQGITTSKTTMQTTVHVPDNNFLILSGMVNNSNAKTKSGIPCLGGLPLIGAAFSQNGDTVVNSNIVIFIRPHIINSVDEMRSLTTKEEDYFRDQSGTPYLQKNFDESMELIKTIDDE
ncbi:MAG: secretin N-terminal domain-containing protein [Chlamydiales bacterium]